MDADGAPVTAVGALRAVDAATRLGARRHPVVVAAILSDFVVRAIEIAVAINPGRHGDLDRPLIRAMARDLAADLVRASQVRWLPPEVTATRYSVHSLTLDQARERYLPLTYIRYVGTAVGVARTFGEGAGRYVAHSSREHDLKLAWELAEGLGSFLERALRLGRELDRARDPARERALDRSLGRTLDLALERARALDRVCAQGVAGRLGIPPVEGLADALLNGVMDDFTRADLAQARFAAAQLTGVRWSLSGTTWPPETDVTALLARSAETEPGSGVLVVRHASAQSRAW